MGFFWDLYQHQQIRRQSEAQAVQEAKTYNLEDRIAALERQMREHDDLLERLIERLEKVVGQDINGDGMVAGR